MTHPSIEDLRARYERLEDIELLKIVTTEARDYREDALDVAREELRRRGKEPPSTSEFLTSLTSSELEGSDLFCADCHAATTDERFPSSGETFFRRLRPGHHPCATCGAVVRDHFVVLWSIPLFCLTRYRVKEMSVPWPGAPKILSSRRLREPDDVAKPHRIVKRP